MFSLLLLVVCPYRPEFFNVPSQDRKFRKIGKTPVISYEREMSDVFVQVGRKMFWF
jgi:hypothetical protein